MKPTPKWNPIRRAVLESLESRQLLSATFSVTALPGNPVGTAEAFNDAGQVAGSTDIGGFLYSKGKTTDFSVPDTFSVAVTAMNASGQVVGYDYLSTGAYPGNQYFIYSGGKVTLLNLYASASVNNPAIFINNAGTVTGTDVTSAGLNRGFVYASGKTTDIGTLGGSNTFVTGINNLGQIVGNSQLSNGQYHAFLYSAGKMTDIDPSASAANFTTNLINDAGQIAGNDTTGAFLYSGGKITHLTPSGGGTLDAQFINAKGDVAGSVFSNQQYNVYLYSGGVLKNLGGNFDEQTFALTGFNNSDELVGDASSSTDNNGVFLYDNGAFHTLNYDLSAIAAAPTPPDFDVEPQVLQNFALLNNNGQILADTGDLVAPDNYILTPATTGSISGTLFHDLNADGVKQSTEPALAGWTVYIDVNDTGSFQTGDPTAKTSSTGGYSFTNLAPGPYTIRFEAPTSDWKQSPQTLTLASGQNITNVNFGTLVLYSYSITDLGTLGGATSVASAINNVGQIVGQSDTASGASHPFLYTISTGKMVDLSSELGANAIVNGINNLGQIVGDIPTGKSDSGGMPETKAFLYSGGKLTILPLLAGTDSDAAIGINDKGQIVGTGVTPPSGLYLMSNVDGFLYNSATAGAKPGNLPSPNGNIGGIAINNSGQIFENSYYPPFKSAGFGADYLYSGGKLLPLPLTTTISTPGPWFGDPVNVSLANTVGYYDTVGGGTPIVSPAMFFSGAQAVTLSDTLPAKSGWNLIAATSLDSTNDIVGQGFNPKGAAHAFLLKPVLASISGTVFNDSNGDGIKQSDEAGLGGWTVYADLNNSGKYVAGDPMATTTASGNYTITGLPAGGFTIRVVPHTGDRQTAPSTATQTLVAAGQAIAGPSFGEVATGPFGGTPAAFGKIQAENFDLGGQNSGYYDPGNVNKGGLYRPAEGVGIGAIPTADGGGYFVGYTLPGEWLDYTVKVAATGTYTLNFRVSSGPVGGKFHLDVDGTNVTGSLAIPATGNYNTYTIVSKTGVHLTAGTHVLRLMIDATGAAGAAGNFDWFDAVET